MILERIDLKRLSKEVRRQQRNRETYSPTVSLFRWWARRSHALFGAIIDAAIEESGKRRITVSDPFSGGGTVAIEAARRGMRVYAQDLQPWPAVGLAAALDTVDPDELEKAGEVLLKNLQPVRESFYSTVCPAHGKSEIIHTFWVRKTICPSCSEIMFLYPTALLTYDDRIEAKTSKGLAWFGCSRCGGVTTSSRDSLQVTCQHCGDIVEANLKQLDHNVMECPHCGVRFDVTDVSLRTNREWRPVLVQRFCEHNGKHFLHFDVPTEQEKRQAFMTPRLSPSLGEIRMGVETQRLITAGFTSWTDLYPARQSAVYFEANHALERQERVSPEVKNRLRLAICGAGEMAGYSSRWDRFHLKAFEAVANHRFSATTFTVEVNPLGPRGRGTLRRRIMHSVRAAKWFQSSRNLPLKAATLLHHDQCSAVDLGQSPIIVIGSSDKQILKNNAADLVLTDPPYYNDVQYGELSDLFVAWARALGLVPPNLEAPRAKEAVPNEHTGVDAARYAELLAGIFVETRRTLKRNGVVVVTFHNTKMEAWSALAKALSRAQLKVVALATVHAENEADHAKRHKMSFSKDLVLECRPGLGPSSPWVATDDDSLEAEELVAIGRALAAHPDGDIALMERDFRRFLKPGYDSRIARHFSTSQP